VLQNQNVTVPLRAPAGDQAVTVEVDGWPGEPSPETNSVRIGTLSRVVAADLPPEPDAQVIDARVVDAQVVDAQVVDAQVVDAQVIDARVADAVVPIFPDFEVFDARFVPDASDGAVVVRVDGAVPVADAGPNTEAGSNTDAFAPTDADGAPDDAAAVDDAGHSGRDAGSPLRDAGRAVDAGPPQRDIDENLELALFVLKEGRFTWREIWTMPIGMLRWSSAGLAKLGGAKLDIWTPEHQEMYDAHALRREAQIDASGKAIEAATGLDPVAARQQAHTEYWAGVKQTYQNAHGHSNSPSR
jgi:hypothetical protein